MSHEILGDPRCPLCCSVDDLAAAMLQITELVAQLGHELAVMHCNRAVGLSLIFLAADHLTVGISDVEKARAQVSASARAAVDRVFSMRNVRAGRSD